MTANIPDSVKVQLNSTGKPKEVTIGFKQVPNNAGYLLEVYESNSRSPKNTYSLKRVLSELQTRDIGPSTLILITTEQEISFSFKNPNDAQAFHNFICEKSEVQAENKAISQLDDEMRMIWPFPGGSFF